MSGKESKKEEREDYEYYNNQILGGKIVHHNFVIRMFGYHFCSVIIRGDWICITTLTPKQKHFTA